jgi:hypothetical protein
MAEVELCKGDAAKPLRKRHRALARGSRARRDDSRPSGAPYVEAMNAFVRLLKLQHVASFADEVGDVDDRKRIRAFDNQKIACSNLAQRFPGPERGQGAEQPAKIEDR